MLIALLLALGVDLIVVVAFAVFVLGRQRWLKRQPGELAGAIRVPSGQVHGLSPKWKHGSGRWVTAAVEQHAGQLARTHALPGADAVHLASALAIGDPGLILAAWGRRLHTGAQAAGLDTAPAQLDTQKP